MSISLNNHEDRIRALENNSSQGSGKIVKLWSGSFGGGTLTLPNVNFKDYSLVIAHIDTENNAAQTAIMRSCNLICPTYDLGGYNYDSIDLIGDDAAGMWLSSNNQVSFHAWAGVWIKNIYALKIYYIFRYNIQLEFIRSINYMINKITHSFASLFLS